MARPHAASLVEDAWHRRVDAVLRRRGWGTRLVSHTGYGSEEFIHAAPKSDAAVRARLRQLRSLRKSAAAP